MVTGVICIGLAAAIIPMMSGVVAEATTYPDPATTLNSAGYSVEVNDADAIAMPKLNRLFVVIGSAVALAVVLLAAAVTRRLHDAGLAGWWGLPTIVFLAAGVGLFPRALALVMQLKEEAPSMGLFFTLFTDNGLYVLCLLGLIVLLVLDGTRGPNRYGPPGD